MFNYAMDMITCAVGHFNSTEIAFEVAFSVIGASIAIWIYCVLRPHFYFWRSMIAGINIVSAASKDDKISSGDKFTKVSKELKGNKVLWDAWKPYQKSLREDPDRNGKWLNTVDPYAWFSVDRLHCRG